MHSAKSSCETYYSPISKLPKDIKDRQLDTRHQAILVFLQLCHAPILPTSKRLFAKLVAPSGFVATWGYQIRLPVLAPECFRLPLRILPCSEGAACNQPDIQLSSPRFNLKQLEQNRPLKVLFCKGYNRITRDAQEWEIQFLSVKCL